MKPNETAGHSTLKRMMQTIGCLGIVTLFGAQASLAATLHVPDDYLTIQAAIDASVDGDTVEVASGT